MNDAESRTVTVVPKSSDETSRCSSERRGAADGDADGNQPRAVADDQPDECRGRAAPSAMRMPISRVRWTPDTTSRRRCRRREQQRDAGKHAHQPHREARLRGLTAISSPSSRRRRPGSTDRRSRIAGRTGATSDAASTPVRTTSDTC